MPKSKKLKNNNNLNIILMKKMKANCNKQLNNNKLNNNKIMKFV